MIEKLLVKAKKLRREALNMRAEEDRLWDDCHKIYKHALTLPQADRKQYYDAGNALGYAGVEIGAIAARLDAAAEKLEVEHAMLQLIEELKNER